MSEQVRIGSLDDAPFGLKPTSPARAWFRTTIGSTTARSMSSSPQFRYVWPSELDLMTRLAGMTLLERWGDWKREPFTSDSTKHVSVWEKSAAR